MRRERPLRRSDLVASNIRSSRYGARVPRDARQTRRFATAIGLGVGYLADQLLGDPRHWHPVAGFGTAVTWWERRSYADDRAHGVVFTTVAIAVPVAAAVALTRLCRGRPPALAAVTAVATWVVLGGRSLAREAAAVADALDDGEADSGDLDAARTQVARLVGRDTEHLDVAGVARAAVESVAENTSDAVVAPLLWGAVAGLPGLLGYRAVNTLDAMVGHRSVRYERFGWAAARLDDVANWVPARVAALIAAVTAPVVGGSPVATAAVVQPRRRSASEPERGGRGGGLRRRAPGSAGWPQPVPRGRVRPRHPR